jgi:hypothetical protein
MPVLAAGSKPTGRTTGPLTVREIADVVLAAKGITDATAKKHEMEQQAVRSSLESHAGKTVERVREGVPKPRRLRQ